MLRYFVTKPNGYFIGQYTIQEILSGVHCETIARDWVATLATESSYPELAQQANVNWITIDELLLEARQSTNNTSSVDDDRAAPTRSYADAYREANATRGFGKLIKALGWICGIITILAGIATSDSKLIIIAFVSSTIQIIIFTFFGVLVSTLGHILRATLDTAVHIAKSVEILEKLKTEVPGDIK